MLGFFIPILAVSAAKEAAQPFAQAAPVLTTKEVGPTLAAPSLADISVELQDVIKQKKPYKPFAKVPVPGVKDITITDVQLTPGISATRSSFTLEGNVSALGITGKGRIGYWKILTTGKNEFLLNLSLGASVTLGKLMPFLKGTFLEQVTVSNPSFLVSTFKYKDPITHLTLRPGLTLLGKLDLSKSGILSNVEKITNTKFEPLTLFGSIGKEPKELSLAVVIPAKLTFKNPNWKSSSLLLQISGGAVKTADTKAPSPAYAPSISLHANVAVKPTDDDEPLNFHLSMTFEADDATLAGTVKGMWKNPLGIKGLEIGNVALQGTVAYTGGMPTGIGVTGEMVLGKGTRPKKIKLAGKIDVKPQKVAILGKINALSLGDLMYLARKMGARVKLPALPPLTFKDVELKFAPFGARIGEILIEKGITVKGSVEIYNKKVTVDVNLDSSGIVAKGYMNAVDIGALKISGLGPDGKSGTADDGPIFDLFLKPEKQHLFISGLINVLGLEAQTHVEMTRNKIKFSAKGKILDAFHAEVTGDSRGNMKHPDFHIVAKFKNSFGEYLYKHLKKHLDTLKDGKDLQAKQAVINQELAKLNEKQKKVGELEKKIKAEEKRFEALSVKEKALQSVKSLASRADWRTEQGKVIAEVEIKKAALKTARDAIILFIKSKKWVGTAAEFLVEGKIIAIKEGSIEGSLRAISQGTLPHLKARIILLGVPVNVDMKLNIKDMTKMGEAIALDIFNKFKAKKP